MTVLNRFCPQCGTRLAPEMAFCPGCGRQVDGAATAKDSETERVAVAQSVPAAERVPAAEPVTERRVETRRGTGLLLPAIIVALGLLGYGWLTRDGGAPALPGQPTPTPTPSAAPTPPITGIAIISPTDGQQVATKDVTVIGMAPPGLTITRDVSLAPDQHTTADGTGHWAMTVGLKDGENKLTFRIGDDQSTKKTIRVIYTPPAS
ncbi:MAG TPA: zinc ribbon domain-containing protein [Candidatus Limnocylindrales bacterium]|jgi:hypothetical protein